MKRSNQRRRRLFPEALESRMLLDASGDFFEVQQNGAVRTLDVLHNDRFAADYSGPKEITSTSFGSKGGLIRIAEDRRSLEYDPPADGFGVETFTYYVDHDSSATVTISIIAPLKHDRFTVNPNDQAWTLDVMANDLFWNDYQDAKRITAVSQTRLGGEVEISEDGKSIVYTPAEYEVGKDSFMYFVDDLYPAEVIVDIVDPLVADKKLNIVWNTESITLDVLANDSFWNEYEGDQRITHLADTDPTKGSFSIASDGRSVIYEPAADFQGMQTIRYVVDSRHEQTITVQVHRPVEDDWFQVTPVTTPDAHPTPSGSIDFQLDGLQPYVNSNGELERNFLHLLGNDVFRWLDDRYAPGDSRRWVTEDIVDRITSVGVSEAGATIDIAPDGQGVRYSPPAGFIGTDTFEYIADGEHVAKVTVVVRAPTGGGGGGGGGGSNQQPPSNVCRTRSDSLVVNQNSSGNVIDVVANDFQQQGYLCDPYYGVRRITEVTEPQNGTVTIGDDRKSVSYTPDADFVGSDTFYYKVDGIWTESITMNVVRRVRDDQFRVEPDSTNELDVLPNDLFGADYTGPQRITGVTESEAGATISISDSRDSIHYTAPAGFTGEDRFTYTVDGGLKAQVTVYVSSSRDALLRKFDSDSLFGPILDEALGQWDHVFGTTIEQYPWYRDVYYSSAVDYLSFDGNASAELRVHSETNVQVQGIDEADIVETDSDFLYVVRDGELIIAKAWPADELSVVSRTRIEGQPIGEYLLGDRLTVVSQSYDDPWRDIFTPDEPETASNPTSNSNSLIAADYGVRFAPDYPTPQSGSTIISVYDVSDRSNPKLVQKTKLDGTYVESRRIDDQVFVVQRSQRLSAPGPTLTCEPIEDQQAASDALIPIDDFHRESCTYETRDDYIARVTELFETMLPHYASYDAEGNLVRTGLAIAPEDIYQPQVKTARNLISVVSINMSIDEPGLSGASGILTSGADTIYGGWDGLYVLERSYSYEDGDITRILKFDWNADTGMVDFAAFGHVAGYLLNQFSVDTFDGHLRIATTLWNRGGGNYSNNAENTIFVLRDDEGVMEVVGDLQNLGFTEYIKSVRFMGDRAFVTTFREIDPFFVIDMSNPQEPLPVGHVTLPGFSSYMQMIDENHVLTIGRNAVTESTGSTQVILFDVTDITRPRIVGRHSFYRDSISIAETDHHAFGWFAAHDVLAIPLAEHRRRRIDTDEDGYRETWEYYREDDLALLEIDVTATVETRDGVELRGEVPNDSQVLRGAFIDNVLYSIAHDSITAVDINDPTIIFAQVIISPDDGAPLDGSDEGEPESRDWLMAKQAREAVVRHLGRPAAPMLLTAERHHPSDGHHDSQRSFLFRVGDQIVHVGTDAEGNASLIDERFEFAARHAARWRNESNPTDVNGDNFTSPIDALLGINELERTGSRKLTTQGVLRQINALVNAKGPLYDVSGDGWLSPIDVLWVINWLENQSPAESEYAAAVDAIVSTEGSYFKVSTQPTRSGPISLFEQSHELLRQAVDESADDDDRDFGDAKMWVPDEDLLSDTAN